MRVDILPAFLLASALTVSGGAWVGYKMSVVVRVALHEAPPPPIEAAPTASEVGVLQGVLEVPSTVIYGRRPPRAAAVAPLSEIRFFDFHRAICDEAEGTHGKVLRCSKPVL